MSKTTKYKAKKSNINPLLLGSIIAFIGCATYIIAITINGNGPLAGLFASKPSINETKTICTRKTDGRKDCTSYETETSNGIKTTTISSEIISDTAGKNKVVEYKYDVIKTAPVDDKGVQTGSSTTVEVRKKIDAKTEKEEVLSTVTTIQKPPATDVAGKPVAPGEVVSEIRTGDISLGVTSYKSGDKNKKEECEKSGKEWKNDTCQKRDERTDEQKCTQDENGKTNGNSWANGACIMKVEPRITPQTQTTSPGVNCDKGTCQTSGSPICYGSYASTGQYIKDNQGNTTGEYDCRLCGDNGAGGVGFTGGPQSCKSLLSQNAPVVLGFSANPTGLGLPSGTQTGSCLSKRGADWILAAVGQPGEGPNEGKYCDVTGGWVSDPPKITPPTANNAPKTPEAQCHAQHPGYIYGQNFDGDYVCVPRNNVNIAMMGNQKPCKAGLGEIGGKDVWIECSGLKTVKSYTFCYGGTGTFDENGTCKPPANVNTNDLLTSSVAGCLSGATSGLFSGPIVAIGGCMAGGTSAVVETTIDGTSNHTIRPIVSSVAGCLGGATIGLFGGPLGVIGGCMAGGTSAVVGTTIGGTSTRDTDANAIISGGIGCVSGGLIGLVGGPLGVIGGCSAGAVAGIVGNKVGSGSKSSVTAPQTGEYGGGKALPSLTKSAAFPPLPPPKPNEVCDTAFPDFQGYMSLEVTAATDTNEVVIGTTPDPRWYSPSGWTFSPTDLFKRKQIECKSGADYIEIIAAARCKLKTGNGGVTCKSGANSSCGGAVSEGDAESCKTITSPSFASETGGVADGYCCP